jgi:hypothetical protein
MRVSNVARYTGSSYSVPTAPSTAIANTTLLTAQSNYYVDNSSNGYAIAVTGTPSVQAFSPFAPTAAYDAAVVGGSGYFDGTDDSLSVPSNAAWALGTGDFTIETWVYISFIKSFEFLTVPGTGAFFWQYQNSGPQLSFGKQGGGGSITSSWAPVINNWYHVAISRVSGTTTQYINGVSIGSTASAIDVTGTGILAIGEGGGGDFQGYFSGTRIVKGSAVYTGNFAVPTAPPTAITNTQLLVNYTNAGIFDSAAKNVAETVGTAQVSTTQAKWGTTSMYFAGSGDYLISPNTKMFTLYGAFTIEAWVYRNTSSKIILIEARTGGGYANYLLSILTNGTVEFVTSTSGNFYSPSIVVPSGQWVHVALVRNTSNVITWYVDGVAASTTVTISGVLSPAASEVWIGAQRDPQYSSGYIDDLRITQYARYTANFTPPAAAFPLQ